MNQQTVRKAPLNWLLAGVLLGLVQIAAIGLKGPLGVSTQFVVVDSIAITRAAPDYAHGHPLISTDKYQKLGYGFWLDVGLVAGALVAAIASRRWRVSTAPVWWYANRGRATGARFLTCFIAGFLILMGARLAHGCTSGQFMSGWAQLSISAIPFTVALFGAGMITARIAYSKVPQIDR